MIKLNLGCGPNYLPLNEGWVNVDIRLDTDWRIDQHWDFTKPLPLPNESVDFILAWHIFEHIGLTNRSDILKDWHRLLKTGGKLAIAVPDILYIFEQYKRGEFAPNDWFIFMVNVYGPYNGIEGDYHRWGYCYDELIKVLNETNFKNCERLTEANAPEEIRKFTLGEGPEKKIVLAPWAAQVLCEK